MSELITEYKNAMRHMAQSVSILTHRKSNDVIGMTVSSASSYDAEPPIFMVAIHRDSSLASSLSLGDPLTMNLMPQTGVTLAQRFSGQTHINGVERFEAGNWDMNPDYAPRLRTALAIFSGQLRALIPQASHAILLVDVNYVHENTGMPLIYQNRSYNS